MEAWSVDPLDGPQVGLPEHPLVPARPTPEEAAALLARWRAMGRGSTT